MIWGLVDTTPHGKKFSFSTGDVDHMINSLDNGIIMDVYVQYWYSNVIVKIKEGKLDLFYFFIFYF